ncbi:hypothetical protein HF521_011075 [Silurus meridionalis]|uniref:CARD domain-containing protein n=1 Tax=Silurus meridionalis TaxID=175797 RepID=A0A8T0AN46_SILME|nr:hypothetical protein HF521_011075 [Silurus meridionalis]
MIHCGSDVKAVWCSIYRSSQTREIIQRACSVESILDKLLSLGTITGEEYQEIKNKHHIFYLQKLSFTSC